MQPNELLRQLEKGTVAPVYLFTGEADLLMDEAWQRLVEQLIPARARQFNGERWVAKEHTAADVIERLSTLAMFGKAQLLMVKNIEAWPKDQKKLLISYLAHPRPTSCLVLTASQKKGLESLEPAVSAVGVIVHFPPLSEREAPRWLQERAGRHGKQLTVRAATSLVELTGLDSNRLERELEKLAAYVGERRKIDLEDVKEVVSSQRSYSVFELLRQVGLRQTQKAVGSLRRLLISGESPLGILALLSRQIRLVWQVKDGLERGIPPGQIGQRLNLYSSALKNYIDQASSFSVEELYRIHSTLREADVTLKSTGTQPEVVLEALIVGLCLKK